MIKYALLLAAAPLLSACVVKDAVDTAVGVATLPVKAGSKAVDLATTSETEKDAKFVRQMRQACEAWEEDYEAAVKLRRRGEDVVLPAPPNENCI